MTRRLFLFLTLLRNVAALQCLDNNGNAVSWWFMLKMPNGFDYAYVE